MSAHQWLVGPQWVRQEDADIEVDCHRRLRGPYTGTATLLRALVPRVHACDPELARKHVIEILAVAPDLQGITGPAPDTLTAAAVGLERTRIYAVGRTRQLAHGVAGFLRSYADRADGVLALSFRNVGEADRTDQEFLAILLRRAGARIKVIIGTRDSQLPDELLSALRTYAVREQSAPPSSPGMHRSHDELLQAFIDSDGTSDDPAAVAAYDSADPSRRAALHDARAEFLRCHHEPSMELGAIPYHLEHGSDPTGAGVRALHTAVHTAQLNGFYHAVIENGMRGRALIDRATQPEMFWHVTGSTANACALLGDAEQAEQLYLEVRRTLALPATQIANSYALAMVYTRYHSDDRRNHGIAKAYLNTAIAIASIWPDPAERAFYTVFNKNALALVEMHAGNPDAALQLVMEGSEQLDRELAPGKHKLHRSVLIANRASLLARLGRLDDALASYDAVIAADPNYPDYYFERADVRRRLGDTDGALCDYKTAQDLAPPLWELHYNRADLLAGIGDLDGAIADLTRAVELEPGELDPRVNLASLLLETGDLEGAQASVSDGILHHPGDPALLCIRAEISLDAGDVVAAHADLDLALTAHPGHVASLAARAAIAYDAGDYAAAIGDLTKAIDVATDNPDLLYNRGRAYQAARRWKAAIADFDRALTLPGAATEELATQRKACLDEMERSRSHPLLSEAGESSISHPDAIGAR